MTGYDFAWLVCVLGFSLVFTGMTFAFFMCNGSVLSYLHYVSPTIELVIGMILVAAIVSCLSIYFIRV